MAHKISYENGSVIVSHKVIATVCGVAAMECYGLVGMAPRSVQEGLFELLRLDDFERGVDVKFNEESIEVVLHIVVEYGLKISEVARNVQERVRYAVEEKLGVPISSVGIRVQSVRVTDEKRK